MFPSGSNIDAGMIPPYPGSDSAVITFPQRIGGADMAKYEDNTELLRAPLASYQLQLDRIDAPREEIGSSEKLVG